MPKEAAFSEVELKNAILVEKDDIVVCQSSGTIAVPTAEVWARISDRLENKISKKYLYTIVKGNRHDTWSILGIAQSTSSTLEQCESQIMSPDSESDTNNGMTFENDPNISFTITLSAEEWKLMKPNESIYRDKGKYSSRYTSRRRYEILKPYQWTHTIHEHFWSHTHLSCVLTFKRARVNPQGTNYLNIIGHCSECNSTFTGVVRNMPDLDDRVLIDCQYSGNFRMRHLSKLKRRVSGAMREQVQQKLCNENTSAVSYRRYLAGKLMEFGDSEPGHLPNLSQLRKARSHGYQKLHLHEDPIVAIQIAKRIPPLEGTIRDIGSDRFFVHYWSNTQLHVYKSYCKNNPDCRLSIDSTGGVVKKIERCVGQMSGNIFLYEATVLDKQSSHMYSVCNMLSERHDTNSIYYWLSEWIRSGAVTPKEIVTDMSLALLSAAVQAFTPYKSLTDYLQECSKILQDDVSHLRFSGCLIRCDIAHIMKNIADWPCLKGQARRVRRFYVRALAQLIQCSDIAEVKILLQAIVVVAMSETEGADIVTGIDCPCERAKELIKTKIAFGTFSDSAANAFLDALEGENIDDPSESLSGNVNSMIMTQSPFKSWVAAIESECVDLCRDIEGDRDNLQYLPGLITPLKLLAEKLPLISAVMTPFYGHGSKTASSTAVESSFKDTKHLMTNRSLAMRVDDFIRIHVSSNEGKMKLAATSTADSIVKEAAIDDDLNMRRADNNGRNDESVSDVDVDEIDADSKVLLDNDLQQHADSPNYDFETVESVSEIDVNSKVPLDIDLQQNTNSSNYHHEEMHAIENWRNQAVPPKKRRQSVYLDPKIEWSHIDLTQKVDPSKCIGLLKNGHRANLQAVRDGPISISLANTCAFDSIIQIVCVAYCDSIDYQAFINLDGGNPMHKLIKTMNSNGVSAASYKLRALLLKEMLPGTQLHEDIYLINAATHAGGMAQRMFTSHPSALETVTCSQDPLCHHGNKKYNLQIIRFPFDSPNMNIAALQEKLEALVRGTESTCYSESCNCECLGVRDSRLHSLSSHLIIEPYTTDLQECDSMVRDVFRTRALDIPTSIKMSDKAYTLRGVVDFRGCVKTRTHVGHYVAHCLRSDDKWELYDDLRDKVIHSPSKQMLNCHLLVYTS